MHLDDRQLAGDQRVPQGHARVRVAPEVHDQTVDVATCGVQAVDQGALVVRLEAIDLAAQLARERPQARVDVGERVAPVDLGLALTEQVQVRAVENEDAHVPDGLQLVPQVLQEASHQVPGLAQRAPDREGDDHEVLVVDLAKQQLVAARDQDQLWRPSDWRS